ncbi:MAG: segregation and condensation protein A [Longimicrobiales bacterium]
MSGIEAFPEFERAISPDEALIIEVDGFEGPLDLLLALARNQKVDIAKISVLQLADQYLAFMESARSRRLELAADYLVMAAWLIYFKSRLVLPQADTGAGPGADEMAAALRWRLQRLQAMRDSVVRLMARDRLGRDVFQRGEPEPVRVIKTRKYSDTLYDLLTAYSQQRIRVLGHRVLEMVRPPILFIEEARARIERMLGTLSSWNLLTKFLPPGWGIGPRRRTALASTFSAALELTRDGRLEIRQMAPFGEIFLKDRTEGAEETVP